MFKNAKVYRLQVPFELDQMGLHAQLGERRFRPCGPVETATMGWTAPLGPKAEMLVHTVGKVHLVAMRRQERLLPGSVVTEAVAERIAEIEQAEMREVARRERTQLREELLAEMLPKAFTRSRVVRAYIDAAEGWVVIDAGSDKAAEELLALLRESLGSFPVKPLEPQVIAAERLSNWIRSGKAADGIELEDSCVLQDAEDARSTVRCRGQDLSAPEIRNHLETGKRAVSVGINWKERFSLLLGEDLSLKRLRFADEVTNELDTGDADDEGALLDAELALLSLELRAVLACLCEEFEVLSEPSVPAPPSALDIQAPSQPKTTRVSAAEDATSTDTPPWA
ncbi:MAG: recombination-associated protein RdgC [Lamprobacter sp.]|uniref:recombination-associated protein RdgC n=1 Tax=Lamprobacter sp. TaxID=3100796 RepID=UPI002B259966|nr:recombination-associated protein RdgC [Lamprobacter sp.]MEA3639531.1 recombination-associated protein RdgC [Lamprobacter sp.]